MWSVSQIWAYGRNSEYLKLSRICLMSPQISSVYALVPGYYQMTGCNHWNCIFDCICVENKRSAYVMIQTKPGKVCPLLGLYRSLIQAKLVATEAGLRKVGEPAPNRHWEIRSSNWICSGMRLPGHTARPSVNVCKWLKRLISGFPCLRNGSDPARLQRTKHRTMAVFCVLTRSNAHLTWTFFLVLCLCGIVTKKPLQKRCLLNTLVSPCFSL